MNISAKLTVFLHKSKPGPHILAILINLSLNELDAALVAMDVVKNQFEYLVFTILIHKLHLFKKLDSLLFLKVLLVTL